MFNEDQWIEFYRSKSVQELSSSIDAIHSFQQEIFTRFLAKTYSLDVARSLLHASQLRENVIMDVIKEKLTNG